MWIMLMNSRLQLLKIRSVLCRPLLEMFDCLNNKDFRCDNRFNCATGS